MAMAGSGMDDPCFLLGLVADELDRHGTAARELAEITFAADGGQIAISTRAQPLPDRYPELSEILDDIGRTCRDEGIAVEQLRRITFFEDERRGGTDVLTWPILPSSLHS
jgi:hypothetical protein